MKTKSPASSGTLSSFYSHPKGIIMSKKLKTAKRNTPQQGKTPVTPSREKKRSAGKKPMLNMLMVLVAILPFMFSWEIIDASLSVRYGLLSGFVILFVIYFFGFRKKLLSSEWPFLIKLVFLMGIAYGLWNIASLFFAVSEQQVYYGAGRHFLNIIFLLIVTEIATREETWLLQLCKLLTVAAILHSIIGICQFYDLAFNDLPGNYKPYGLMNNRNLFGTGQVLLLSFATFVLYKASRAWKYIAGIALAGIVISAILSQTRSSWLAGLVFTVGAVVLIFVFSPSNRKKWVIGTLAGLGTTVVLALLLIASDLEGGLSQSLKERTGKIFATDTTGDVSSAAGNVTERLKIWSKTMELIRDNPLTGVGPGNWKIVVPKYGSEGLVWAKGKYVPDSPHNDYLLVIAESGIPGALLYFGIWVLIAVMAFKTIVRPQTEERRVLNILMLCGLAGFAVDSLFSFPSDRIEHTLYVYLMAGIVMGTFINSSIPAGKGSSPGYKLKLWQLAVFVVVGAFNLFLSVEKYNFEKYISRSKFYEANKYYQQSIDEGNKGKSSFVSIAPNSFPMETYTGLSYKGLKNYPAAFKELDIAIEHHPYNKALYVNKGTIFTDLAQYDSAIIYYNKALKLNPEFDLIFFNLASNYYQLKNYKACLEALSKVSIDGYQQLQLIKQEATARLAEQQQQPK